MSPEFTKQLEIIAELEACSLDTLSDCAEKVLVSENVHSIPLYVFTDDYWEYTETAQDRLNEICDQLAMPCSTGDGRSTRRKRCIAPILRRNRGE